MKNTNDRKQLNMPSKFSKITQPTIAIALLVVIGAFLRLFHLDYQSLWLDELHSIIPTSPIVPIEQLIHYAKSDQPPAFFLILHYAFRIFEYNEVTGRVICALIGIASLPACYWLGKELYDRNAGILACLLATFNYYHVYYSQDLRFYSLTFLLTTLSYLYFVRAFKRHRPLDFVLYTVATSVLLYTHYYGLLIFGIQFLTFIVLIFFFKRDKAFIIGGALSGLLVGISFLPWMPVILSDLGITGFWLERPKFYFLAKFVYEYFGKDAVTTLIFIFCVYLFLRMLYKQSFEKGSAPLLAILILWCVLSYLVPYVKSFIGVPVLLPRYTIVTLPALFVVFSIGILQIADEKWRTRIIGAIILSFSVNTFIVRQYYTKAHKTQFREASQFTLSNVEDGVPIVSHLTWYFEYYFRNQPVKVQDVSTLPEGVERFWLLTAHYPEPKRNELKSQFLEKYEIVNEQKFYEAEAILFVIKKR